MKKKIISETVRSTIFNMFIFCIVAFSVYACTNAFEATENASHTAQTVTSNAPTDGALMGSVIATNLENVTITANNGQHEIKGTVDEMGEYFMTGLQEGTYSVMITGLDTETVLVDDVEIAISEVTALGTYELQ